MKTELGSFKLRERKVTASLEYTAHPHLKTDKHPQRFFFKICCVINFVKLREASAPKCLYFFHPGGGGHFRSTIISTLCVFFLSAAMPDTLVGTRDICVFRKFGQQKYANNENVDSFIT